MKLRWMRLCTVGVPILCVLFLGSASLRAAEPTNSEARWETSRATIPDDLNEIKALQERVKKVVDKCSPSLRWGL